MGKIVNANICPNELRSEWVDTFKVHEKWIIEIWGRSKNNVPKLQDLIEMPFDTQALANVEVARLIEEQKKDNQIRLNAYADRLQEFVMDETTDDKEPPYPEMYNLKFIPKKYLTTMLPDGRYGTLIYEFD